MKKFFLYIMLPSVVLGMVYQSGRNEGRKQAIENSAAQVEFPVTEKPIVKPEPMRSEPMPEFAPVVRAVSKPITLKKLPAKPKTEPAERFVQRIPAQVIETDEEITPVTFAPPMTGRSVYDRVSPLPPSGLQPLQPLESSASVRTAIKPVPDRPVISVKNSADCDCGKVHQ